MKSYVAFLRGINVGGHGIVAMKDLAALFTSMGFSDVKTLLQSGNVLFGAGTESEAALARRIEQGLAKLMGESISVLVRSMARMDEIIRLDPFKDAGADAKPYVTFLGGKPAAVPRLPLFSPKRDVEIMLVSEREMFCLSHVVKGQGGFPNAFIEKHFGMQATTRNWNTVQRVAAFASRP